MIGAWVTPVQGIAEPTFPPREMALLPPYCKYSNLFRNIRMPGARWASIIGRSFADIHHYCFRLIARTTPGSFHALLSSANAIWWPGLVNSNM